MGYPVECFLIDDDTDDQEIFSMALQEMNTPMNCAFANDGVQALQKIRNDESFIPDYIFIDINMPRMGGIECLAAIKSTQHIKHIPVFMYSTSSDPAIIAKTKKLGAADFIVKPASVDALRNMLAKIFDVQKKAFNAGQ